MQSDYSPLQHAPIKIWLLVWKLKNVNIGTQKSIHSISMLEFQVSSLLFWTFYIEAFLPFY